MLGSIKFYKYMRLIKYKSMRKQDEQISRLL